MFDMSTAKVRMGIWRSCREHVFAAAWEEIARSGVMVSDRMSSLSGSDGYWLPAGRWWRGNAPEWDVVSTNGSGTRILLGEVKWSERPFSWKVVGDLVRSMKARKIPVGLSGSVQYALFVPAVEPGAACGNGFDGVEILTAEDFA